jgi:hypothetical protein
MDIENVIKIGRFGVKEKRKKASKIGGNGGIENKKSFLCRMFRNLSVYKWSS